MDGASGGNESKVFGSKPARGWSHCDKVIINEGVQFNVRVSISIEIFCHIYSIFNHMDLFQYIGCLEIKTSMKLLDFTLRSQVAK